MRKYGRLKERIKEKYRTQKPLAAELGLNLSTLNQKLNGHTEWTRGEVEKICILLDNSTENMNEYFFY